MNLIKPLILGISLIILLAGCNHKDENHLKIPSSARVHDNLMTIPFPYAETLNGEQWTLNRDTSNHFVIQLINQGKVIATFPFGKKIFVGTNKEFKYSTHGVIELDEKKYNVINITLNNDYTSGIVTLCKM